MSKKRFDGLMRPLEHIGSRGAAPERATALFSLSRQRKINTTPAAPKSRSHG